MPDPVIIPMGYLCSQKGGGNSSERNLVGIEVQISHTKTFYPYPLGGECRTKIVPPIMYIIVGTPDKEVDENN
jgi:hypothetical protein